MAHYEDLAPFEEVEGLSSRPLAVGWLAKGRPYKRGTCSPEFVTALKHVLVYARRLDARPRAEHVCEFCRGIYSARIAGLAIVPGVDRSYACPAMITHYIVEHGYQPPTEFIAAVMLHAERRAKPMAESVERVRRYPSAYFVGAETDLRGLTGLLLEIVGNSVDEYLAGRATKIEVSIDKSGTISVEDNGGGLPIAAGPTPQPQAVIDLFCRLHVGATLDGHRPHVHLREVGVGAAPVCALSSRFEVETWRDGLGWRALLARGTVTESLSCTGPTARRGTRLTFEPDAQIFGALRMTPELAQKALATLGYLCPGLDLEVEGKSLSQRDGLAAFVRLLAPDVIPATIVRRTQTVRDVEVDVAIGWSPSGEKPRISSFVNYYLTELGGRHANAVLNGVRATGPDERVAKLALGGLVSAVHIGLQHPRFESPTRALLASPQAGPPVKKVVTDMIRDAGWWWDSVIDLMEPAPPKPRKRKPAP